MTKFRIALFSILIFVLNACSSTDTSPGGGQGHYKVGNPYQIDGRWYYPKEDYSYDETGIASWYGADFHNGVTANGEIFNKNELTAAHKTLPLPTLARITNLDNGRSIVVRVNDRGPFSGARIIDVSQRAAQLLGFEQQGTAKVRVQVLADESKAIADAMRHYGSNQPAVAVAAAAASEGAADSAVASSSSSSSSAATAPSSASVVAVESKELEPVHTTPAVHQQLMETKPVPQVVQVPVTGARRLYVQAGAFTVLENASHLKQSLEKFGSVSISNIAINGKMYYRVRVGPIASIDMADKTLLGIRKAGYPEARTTVD